MNLTGLRAATVVMEAWRRLKQASSSLIKCLFSFKDLSISESLPGITVKVNCELKKNKTHTSYQQDLRLNDNDYLSRILCCLSLRKTALMTEYKVTVLNCGKIWNVLKVAPLFNEPELYGQATFKGCKDMMTKLIPWHLLSTDYIYIIWLY